MSTSERSQQFEASIRDEAIHCDRLLGSWTGTNPGPTLIVICGVHGNERAGVHAAEEILNQLSSIAPDQGKGRVVVIAGNLAALAVPEGGVRYLDRDLNRIFSEAGIAQIRAASPADLDTEQREALELMQALEAEIARASGLVYALDLHTVSAESPPFVFVEDSLPAREFVHPFGVPVILGFEEELHGLLIDHLTNGYGVTAAILEAGHHDDEGSQHFMAAAIQRAITYAGILSDDLLAESIASDEEQTQGYGQGRAGHIYDVRHRDPITSPDYAVEADLQPFDHLRRDHTVVAREKGRVSVAPMTGLLFMPNRQEEKRPGDDGYFIVQRVNRTWLMISAGLRRFTLLHWLLPKLAPGVRHDPSHAGRLLVDVRYAPVFKRELFHLFGYRIHSRGPDLHWPWWRRIWTGAIGIAAAILGILLGIFKGGEKGVLREPSEHDWVISRRTLDTADRPNARQ